LRDTPSDATATDEGFDGSVEAKAAS
jgi:hypothetical protein